MAFNKEFTKYMAAQAGLDMKDFVAKLADEAVHDITVPKAPAKVFETIEDFETYNTNLKAPEYGRGVDDGKKNATEVFIKGIKEVEGLQITGSQLNQDGLLSALKNKYGGDNKKLIDQFESEKKTWLAKIDSTEQTYAQKLAEQEKLAQTLRLKTESITGIKNKTKFDKFDGIELILKDITIEKDAAGKEFIHYKGVPQKNDKLEPLEMKEVTNNIFIEKQWYADDAGRGKGNEAGSGAGATSLYKDFVKEMEEKNVSHGSATYQDELNKRMESKEFMKSIEEA